MLVMNSQELFTTRTNTNGLPRPPPRNPLREGGTLGIHISVYYSYYVYQ